MFNMKNMKKLLGKRKTSSLSMNLPRVGFGGFKSSAIPFNTNKILRKYNLKSFGGRRDIDGDGIVNWKDCQPRNTMRQHRFTDIKKLKDRTIYKNPEGRKITIYKGLKNVPSVDDVAYVVEQSPRQYVEGLNDIKILSREKAAKLVEKECEKNIKKEPNWKKFYEALKVINAPSKSTRAQYSSAHKDISIYPFKNEEELKKDYKGVFLHELGHHQDEVNPGIKEQWTDIYPIEGLTFYGSINELQSDSGKEKEDVAESFVVYHEPTYKEDVDYDRRFYEDDPPTKQRMAAMEMAVGPQKHGLSYREEIEIKQSPTQIIAEEELSKYRVQNNLIGDEDGDGVTNIMDCDVDDENEQGPFDSDRRRERYNVKNRLIK